jgi:hypothetical protein
MFKFYKQVIALWSLTELRWPAAVAALRADPQALVNAERKFSAEMANTAW